MNMSDSDQFVALLEANMALYNRDLSAAVIALWFDDLMEYDLPAIQQAFKMHRKNPDNGQYPPKPADIEKLIGGTSTDRALIAWSKVKKAIGSVGAYNTAAFDDHLIHAVVSDMGGWAKLCHTSNDELPFCAKEFERRYRSALYNPPSYHPKTLVGLSEQYNLSNGLEHTEAPLTVGCVKSCRLVYFNGGEGNEANNRLENGGLNAISQS